MLYLFEDLALDSDRRELRQGSTLVPVEPQVFDLLVFLVRNRDRVVSKDELIESVWGGRVVAESTLDSRINAVRRAVGDTGREQRLIRTTIGKGIRFVGEIREHPVAAESSAPPLAQFDDLAHSDKPPRRPRIMAALILSLVFVLGLGIWRISLPPARNAGGVSQASPMSASSLAKPVPRLSIVVLPFANLSNDAEQQYFVDAITDDLTSNLSRIVNSFVIARTTAFTYQGKAVDIKQLGRDLGVRYVLQGSARRAGEQVEVDVQLIDAESGTNVWTDRFDTSRTDLTNAEDEFTARLARALELQLVEAVGRRIERDSPANLDAHDLIMHGWAYYNRPQSMENLKLADDAFERALAMDPSSVDARVGIARVLGELLATGITKLPAERSAQIARAEDVLHHTLEHDRNNAEAHADLGRIRRIEGKLNESQIELEKSLELDRNQELAIIQSGITALLLGKPSVALPYFEKFRQINPQSQNSFFIYYWLGESHLMLSEATEAIDLLRKGHSANPDFLWAKFMLAASLGFNGNIDEAKSMFEAFRKQRQDLASFRSLDASSINWNTAPDFVALRQKTIDVGLRRAGMPEE